MMTQILKQVIGIDVAMDELVCVAAQLDINQRVRILEKKSFTNNHEGFAQLVEWKATCFNEISYPLGSPSKVWFVMEATGVYNQHLAYYLVGAGEEVSIQLANRVKNFSRSLNVKSKTDLMDAEVIAKMGLERKMEAWNPPSDKMRQIRSLCREYSERIQKRSKLRNQLHALEKAYGTSPKIIRRYKREEAFITELIEEIEIELKMIVQEDDLLRDKMKKLKTIPGLGFMTLIILIGETQGFSLIENGKQLASYAGFDVVEKQSGRSRGKSYISKKGNRFIRQALYMPALAATRCNQPMKDFYQGLAERKPAKRIAVTAVARKLLILTYTLWKNDTVFDPSYGAKAA